MSATSSAAGPDIRIIETAPAPAAVEMAAMVLRE
jgi:hypothetical protein